MGIRRTSGNPSALKLKGRRLRLETAEITGELANMLAGEARDGARSLRFRRTGRRRGRVLGHPWSLRSELAASITVWRRGSSAVIGPDGRKMPGSRRGIPGQLAKGKIRHPVYGHRGVWVDQRVVGGTAWFYGGIRKKAIGAGLVTVKKRIRKTVEGT